MAVEHTPIPPYELEWFKRLKDVQVVFDVGARADADYIKLKPGIELHAFEPNPDFFLQLQEAVGDYPKAHLNNYGLGDVEGEFMYNDGRQAFVGGEETSFTSGARAFPVKTLNWYVESNNIQRIDFLKIDVEGYDYKVLVGGDRVFKMAKYIQYEYWNNKLQYHDLFEKEYDMVYIGDRNVLCVKRPWPL